MNPTLKKVNVLNEYRYELDRVNNYKDSPETGFFIRMILKTHYFLLILFPCSFPVLKTITLIT